ncbi:uncharacterized protein LOC128280470 [Gossypium arboreum]|uniref:uncharacterized protein LOC128280470 n=1 Tax=Gossypium arboreum TaxID=29729 RepID=UPI0022F1D191|nr:uncharacterized protein LOC128280470 [Gossypium arboreum]
MSFWGLMLKSKTVPFSPYINTKNLEKEKAFPFYFFSKILEDSLKPSPPLLNSVAGPIFGSRGPPPSTTIHGGQNSKRVRRGQRKGAGGGSMLQAVAEVKRLAWQRT